MFRDLDDRRGQAGAIGNLGAVQARTGDYPAATASLTQALGMFRDIGDRDGQAGVLNDLGEVLSRSADSHQARDHHAQALAIAREISVPVEEARHLRFFPADVIGPASFKDGTGQLLTLRSQAWPDPPRPTSPTATRSWRSGRRPGPRCVPWVSTSK